MILSKTYPTVLKPFGHCLSPRRYQMRAKAIADVDALRDALLTQMYTCTDAAVMGDLEVCYAIAMARRDQLQFGGKFELPALATTAANPAIKYGW